MQSFDFDRLDPIALEATLAYLRQHPEPPAEDVAVFGGYQGMLDEVVQEKDWMAEQWEGEIRDVGAQSSFSSALLLPTSNMDSQQHKGDSQMGTEGPTDHLQQSTLGAATLKAGIPNLRKRSRSDNCTWVGCQKTSFPENSLRNHLECHSLDVVARWTRGSKCTWQGCKTQAVFKTPSQIKEHLKNIHTEPLLCDQPGCLYTKPFRNMADLNRHKSTKHYAEPKWECPYSSCSSEQCVFARKDKWLKHIQDTHHENDGQCPLPHCILKESELNWEPPTREGICKHLAYCHVGRNADGYSCSLGSCEKTRYLDRWTLQGLIRHLIYHHDLPSFEMEEVGTNRVFTLEHISRYRPDRLKTWVDCNICASQLETAAQPPSTN
ncbi:hypothetical protein V8E51_012729 [Hyaloscypha variabilis]